MDVGLLIHSVRARKPLWDRKHAYYHDRIVTMGMWNEVALALDTDPDSARSKWKGLRDTFRGELRKVNKSIANGTPCQSTNWEYFDDMLFVKDQIYSNKRSLAEMLHKPLNDLSSVDEINGYIDAAVLCKTEVAEDDEECKPSTEQLERQQSSVNRESHSPTLEHPHVLPTDGDYNFLMSILPQLRSLPTMRNLFVRLKIQELLYHEIVNLQES